MIFFGAGCSVVSLCLCFAIVDAKFVDGLKEMDELRSLTRGEGESYEKGGRKKEESRKSEGRVEEEISKKEGRIEEKKQNIYLDYAEATPSSNIRLPHIRCLCQPHARPPRLPDPYAELAVPTYQRQQARVRPHSRVHESIFLFFTINSLH